MNAESTLETVAEIGVSLAGFAGIVGALAGEKLRPAHPEVWIPFSAMISSALGIVFVALFPFLPHHFGASDHVLWAVSSAFGSTITAGNLAFFMPRIWRAQLNGVVPRILAFDVPIQLSAIFLLVSQVLNALGIGLSQSAGGFLIGLYLLVVISGLNFVFLLYILHRTPGHLSGPDDPLQKSR